jgi:hypothetical protein
MSAEKFALIMFTIGSVCFVFGNIALWCKDRWPW